MSWLACGQLEPWRPPVSVSSLASEGCSKRSKACEPRPVGPWVDFVPPWAIGSPGDSSSAEVVVEEPESAKGHPPGGEERLFVRGPTACNCSISALSVVSWWASLSSKLGAEKGTRRGNDGLATRVLGVRREGRAEKSTVNSHPVRTPYASCPTDLGTLLVLTPTRPVKPPAEPPWNSVRV